MKPSGATNVWADLPGWERVSAGLADLQTDRLTPAASVISIIWPRLSRARLVDEAFHSRRISEPERTLYRLLREKGGDAFSGYNAILRRAVSFERAMDRLLTRQQSERADGARSA